VYGNNGGVSCSAYCAGNNGTSWNGELPSSLSNNWNGATCIATSVSGIGCDDVYGTGKNIQCTCQQASTKGWTQPQQVVTGNNGAGR
jgi:hypothetical protein